MAIPGHTDDIEDEEDDIPRPPQNLPNENTYNPPFCATLYLRYNQEHTSLLSNYFFNPQHCYSTQGFICIYGKRYALLFHWMVYMYIW